MAQKEKTVGAVHEKRRYDLPLNKDAGAGFLTLLFALMTFLAAMALASSFVLSAMAERWTSGLENKMTVEVPAQDANGNILRQSDMDALAGRIEELLQSHPAVKQVHIMDAAEVMTLVKPWLGAGMNLDNAPLPRLITIEIGKDKEFNPQAIAGRIAAIAPQASLETHESWLRDVLRFTGTLQFAAAVLTIIIGITSVTAVAGAIRSRMAVHREEVNLLHLMGAADRYIARQFQHHSLRLAFKGALLGLITGLFALWLTGRIASSMDIALLPDFHMGLWHFAALLLLPFIAAAIAALTAGWTARRALEDMP